jgi:hypothetical protein
MGAENGRAKLGKNSKEANELISQTWVDFEDNLSKKILTPDNLSPLATITPRRGSLSHFQIKVNGQNNKKQNRMLPFATGTSPSPSIAF